MPPLRIGPLNLRQSLNVNFQMKAQTCKTCCNKLGIVDITDAEIGVSAEWRATAGTLSEKIPENEHGLSGSIWLGVRGGLSGSGAATIKASWYSENSYGCSARGGFCIEFKGGAFMEVGGEAMIQYKDYRADAGVVGGIRGDVSGKVCFLNAGNSGFKLASWSACVSASAYLRLKLFFIDYQYERTFGKACIEG
jgi:hypothetical protein